MYGLLLNVSLQHSNQNLGMLRRNKGASASYRLRLFYFIRMRSTEAALLAKTRQLVYI